MCIQLHTLYIELMVSTYHTNCIYVLYPVFPYIQSSSIIFFASGIYIIFASGICFRHLFSLLFFRHLYYPWNCFQLYYYITHVITLFIYVLMIFNMLLPSLSLLVKFCILIIYLSILNSLTKRFYQFFIIIVISLFNI